MTGFDLEQVKEWVILVGVSEQEQDDTKDSLEELAQLAKTAGAQVAAFFFPWDPDFFLFRPLFICKLCFKSTLPHIDRDRNTQLSYQRFYPAAVVEMSVA